MTTSPPPQPRSATQLALPATVIALGVVSLLTDLSSEMIYPLLPVFLTAVLGAGPEVLGLIEGVAESTASLVKVVSGLWSDRAPRRKPFVVAGYSLAGAARPLIGLAAAWPAVLLLRFVDRVGKGLRTSPRDALIADATPTPLRGAGYGLQRALDHAGAVAGPLVAAALLTLGGLSLRTVFLLAIVPAVAVVVVLVAWVREPQRSTSADPVKIREAWRELGVPTRVFLAAELLFTLGNSTDAFLLLLLSAIGLPAARVALVWAAFHVVKMIASFAGGRLSDRVGRKPMMIAGWTFYAAVYGAFALAGSPALVIATFLAYGLYYGMTEPVERAWVADLVPPHLRGTAFGLYHGVIGFAALPASLLFGLLWERFGAPAAFLTGAGLALAATVVLFFVRSGKPRP